MTTTATYVFIGPMNKGKMLRAHAPGCAHIARDLRGSAHNEPVHTCSATSRKDAAKSVADSLYPGNAHGDGPTGPELFSDIEWAPCLHGCAK